MDISQALRLINRPNSPQLSAAFEGSPAGERNLDLFYLSGGVPIVRIEAWLAYHRERPPSDNLSSSNSIVSIENCVETSTMCRDLSVVTCVYGSHVTVGLTADCRMDGKPGLDLILNTMLKQLNRLYKLLDSRFPAKPVIYAPPRRLHMTSGSGTYNSRVKVIQGSPRLVNRPQTPDLLRISPAAVHESPPCPDVVIGELVSFVPLLLIHY